MAKHRNGEITMNNDRFKFRVWDVDKNKMIFPGIDYWDGKDFIIDTKGTLGFISDVFGEVCWSANESEFIKNQCTGIKDKNGVLVYEGDILARKDSFVYSVGKVEWEDTIGSTGFVVNARIERHLDCGEIEISHRTDYLHTFVYKEVIGNIYQNPELLDK